MPEQSDEAIVREVQQGGSNLFGLLVERYEKKMLRYARKFLLGGEDAEDLAQEVFLKAYTNIQSFDSRRRFSPWLYRIAHNEFVNAIKKNGASRYRFLILAWILMPFCPTATLKQWQTVTPNARS